MRRLLTPSWMLRHILAIFLIGLFVRLGWWQLVKGGSDHGTLQNLFYGLEWPIFAGTVAFFWWKMVREELRPSAGPAPSTEPGTLAPTAVVADEISAGAERAEAAPPGRGGDREGRIGDDHDGEDLEELELAAYNRYLASLYASSTRGAGR